jgi:Holliday junction DNA helicase RuvA
MIGWLEGTVRHLNQRGHRFFVTIAYAGVGYEVQLLQSTWQNIHLGSQLERWIHQVVSEDNLQLFGFESVSERDLFRELINVNGVGPQAAMALLDALGLDELVKALINSDVKTLCRAQGVGRKTAERLALELKSKLVDSSRVSSFEPTDAQQMPSDLIVTLETLGYENQEIQAALQQLSDRGTPLDQADSDAWLRACIKLMSEPVP